MLVVQTNNATFGYTDESAQQLAMSRLRAVEHGRTVVVAATSGICAVVAPDGSVVALVRRCSRPTVLVEEIAQRDSARPWPQRLGAGARVGADRRSALGALAAVAGRCAAGAGGTEPAR